MASRVVNPAITLEQAQRKGWTIQVKHNEAFAYYREAEEPTLHVISDDPELVVLANIADREGRGFLHGYGLHPDVPCYHPECCKNNEHRPLPPSKRPQPEV